MRRRKQIAQDSPASMSFICRWLQEVGSVSLDRFTDAQRAWLTGLFAKVCCRVDSDEELMQNHDKALKAQLEVPLITDSGKTNFYGLPTRTAFPSGLMRPRGSMRLRASSSCCKQVRRAFSERGTLTARGWRRGNSRIRTTW
ncbi:MAG: peptidyl-tRNA hydrolase [Pirellulaceae bacterium]